MYTTYQKILTKSGGEGSRGAMQKNTRKKLGQTLVDMGILEEEDLITVYSMQLGYKKADNFILLDALAFQDILPSASLFAMVFAPPPEALSYCIISER